MPSSAQPLASQKLTAPELWVILKALRAVAPATPVPPEISVDPVAVPAAQTALLLAGTLDAGPYGNETLRVSPEVEALVRPTLYPDTVFVATVTPSAKSGKPARLVCFNWSPATLVVNWVNEANEHHFVSYRPEDTLEVVLDQIQNMCDLDVDDPAPARANLSPKQVEREMEQMKESVLVMAIQGIQEAQQTPRALGWFVSGRQGWLMQETEEGEKSSPTMVSRAEILLALSQFVERALALQPVAA